MRKVELIYTTEQYPIVFEILVDGRKNNNFIINSPFGNCQSYSFNNFAPLSHSYNLNQDEWIILFKECYKYMSKYQFVIDIKKERYYQVMKDINFIIDKIQIIEYTNTNGTPMMLCLIQLDKTKLV